MPDFLPGPAENPIAGRKMPDFLPGPCEIFYAGRKNPDFLPGPAINESAVGKV